MSAIGSRQRAAIARIDYKMSNGKFGQGTGFAIGRNRILTAWHVLEAGTEHAASFGGDRAGVPLKGPRSDRLTAHNQDDWVLVECDVPDDVEPIELAPLRYKANAPAWRTRAFPSASPNPVYLDGKIDSWDDTGLVDLSLDARWDGMDLGGASGAPIFINERVVGIAIHTTGKSKGLFAIDAARILANWPKGQPRPASVTARVPYELWVRQALASWLAANNDARELAASLTGLDVNIVDQERLARVLMTSTADEALAFVKRTITGANLEKLIELSCTLWVPPGAACLLSEAAFGKPKLAVLCCTKTSVIDHLCVAEGLAKDGIPAALTKETLSVTYDFGEPAEDALWKLVRTEALKKELDPSSVGDAELAGWVNDDYAAIAVEKTPPAQAIKGLRDRKVTLPVVAFSREATPAVAQASGAEFIEPFPDEAQERRANRRRSKSRSGGGTT